MQKDNITDLVGSSETAIYKVPNLEKGLSVLELLSESVSGMTLQEIKTVVDISQTTAYRILNTLARRGYLIYDDSSKKYLLSRKMLTIGFGSVKEHSLMDVIVPRMRELRDEIGESVFFGVLNEEGIIVIERSIGTHAFCFYVTPGKRVNLHCSAPGKAMLAFLPEEIKNKYLDKMVFETFNENTISNRCDYEKQLEKVKKTGYAVDMEEEMTGVVCVGAPIFDYANMPCSCIWTSGPKDRLKSQIIERIGKRFVEVTMSLSAELGYVKH